ncbi:hypothetical protein K440DRAFT_629770 [Wilcoxina mikolae CBS 423.85]|nr:hypothetical protein K440DRAFT_629770 [Wilcoxina mikolae CBS 423.85]
MMNRKRGRTLLNSPTYRSLVSGVLKCCYQVERCEGRKSVLDPAGYTAPTHTAATSANRIILTSVDVDDDAGEDDGRRETITVVGTRRVQCAEAEAWTMGADARKSDKRYRRVRRCGPWRAVEDSDIDFDVDVAMQQGLKSRWMME